MGNPFLFSSILGGVGNVILRSLKYVIAYILSIRTCHRAPRIYSFYSSEQLLIQGGILKLVWRTRYAAFVHIKELGFFMGKREVALPVRFKEQSFTITAYGFLRKTSKTIALTAMDEPHINQPILQLATPSIRAIKNGQFSLKKYQLKIISPSIQVKGTINSIVIPD